MENNITTFQEGDIISTPLDFGVLVKKIIRVDPDSDTYHCLVYQPTPAAPGLQKIPDMPVLTWHSPIDIHSVEQNGTLIGNLPVTPDELCGYHEYLKRTNLPRYLEEINQDTDKLIDAAHEYYRQGCKLKAPGQEQAAIQAFTAAIEIYPYHYYSLDNRGLIYMKQGDFRSAMKDFEASLKINPDNFQTLLSLGECYQHLGNIISAQEMFRRAGKIKPLKAALLTWLLKRKLARINR